MTTPVLLKMGLSFKYDEGDVNRVETRHLEPKWGYNKRDHGIVSLAIGAGASFPTRFEDA